MNIICVCTGKKYTDWYVDNLKHMIDTYSGLKYDTFNVIRENKHNGVFNKLQMFDKFREGQNLYFDLDVVIKGPVPDLLRKDLTLIHAWWREAKHTPVNSSIMSWYGDQSHIYEFYKQDVKGLEKKYYRGMDQFIFENIKHKTYDKVCNSIQGYEYLPENDEYNIWLFNQRYMMFQEGWTGWWKNYFIENTAINAS